MLGCYVSLSSFSCLASKVPRSKPLIFKRVASTLNLCQKIHTHLIILCGLTSLILYLAIYVKNIRSMLRCYVSLSSFSCLASKVSRSKPLIFKRVASTLNLCQKIHTHLIILCGLTSLILYLAIYGSFSKMDFRI